MTSPAPPPSDPDPPPALDPSVVADDELLGETVDEFVRRAIATISTGALGSASDRSSADSRRGDRDQDAVPARRRRGRRHGP